MVREKTVNVLFDNLEAKLNKCGGGYATPSPLHSLIQDPTGLLLGLVQTSVCSHSVTHNHTIARMNSKLLIATCYSPAENPSMAPHRPQNNFQTFHHGSRHSG